MPQEKYKQIKALTIDPSRPSSEYYIRCVETNKILTDATGAFRVFDFHTGKAFLQSDEKSGRANKSFLSNIFQMPKTVYVLGSGEKAHEAFNRIPKDAYVIACNKAVLIPRLIREAKFNVSVWVVADADAVKKDWFGIADRTFQGLRIFSDFAAQATDSYTSGTAEYLMFPLSEPCRKPKWEPDEKGLRIGGTVGLTAVETAVRCGARKIYLCGFDMSGDTYFDGSENIDDRHGEVWPTTKGFDAAIKYFQRQGIKIYTLSETKLETPEFVHDETPEIKMPAFGNLSTPSIAYLCMSFDPIDRMNAIIDCIHQDYPNELKTLYILRQRTKEGEFPRKINHNMPIRIREIDVEGKWPELWLLKLMAFCEAVEEDVTVWWDEDDRYPLDYTRKSIAPILTGKPLAWNYDCIIVENGRFWNEFYRSPIGTLTARTEVLRKLSVDLYAQIYQADSSWRSPKRLERMGYNGAKDDQFRRNIDMAFDPVPQHIGLKYYFATSQTNTIGKRPAYVNLDYKPGVQVEKEWLTRLK